MPENRPGEPGQPRCAKCLKHLPGLARFCNRCGEPVAGESPAAQARLDSLPGSAISSAPSQLSPSQAVNSLVIMDRAQGASGAPAATGRLIAGRYRIGGIAGRGGLGVVYEADDEKEKKRVALKILLPRLMKDPGILARFRDQVLPLSVLKHENIVEVLDAGATSEVAYLVMPFMPGGTLRPIVKAGRRARPGPSDMRRIVTLAAQAARGLSYAHRYVVHRDLKPENILIDGSGCARIADFDLAKFRRASPLTMTGDAMGTAYYMAPEQIRDPSRVDGRADLFSLGVIIFEALSGELPMGSFRPLIRTVPGCPPALDDLVMKLLSPDPDNRFGNAEEAATALSGIADGLK